MLFCCLYFTRCSDVFIVYFEQVNTGPVLSIRIIDLQCRSIEHYAFIRRYYSVTDRTFLDHQISFMMQNIWS